MVPERDPKLGSKNGVWWGQGKRQKLHVHKQAQDRAAKAGPARQKFHLSHAHLTQRPAGPTLLQPLSQSLTLAPSFSRGDTGMAPSVGGEGWGGRGTEDRGGRERREGRRVPASRTAQRGVGTAGLFHREL